MLASGDFVDVIIRLGALAGALAAIGFVVAFLYRRTGLISLWRWMTRHIREDRAAERRTEFLDALQHPVVKQMRRQEISEVITEEVTPRFDALADRLTQHMAEEEAVIHDIHTSIQQMAETTESHMRHDEAQFLAAQSALGQGQEWLKASIDTLSERIAKLERRRPSR